MGNVGYGEDQYSSFGHDSNSDVGGTGHWQRLQSQRGTNRPYRGGRGGRWKTPYGGQGQHDMDRRPKREAGEVENEQAFGGLSRTASENSLSEDDSRASDASGYGQPSQRQRGIGSQNRSRGGRRGRPGNSRPYRNERGGRDGRRPYRGQGQHGMERRPKREADEVENVKAFGGLSRTASEVSLFSTATAGEWTDFEDDSSVGDTSDNNRQPPKKPRVPGKLSRGGRGRPGNRRPYRNERGGRGGRPWRGRNQGGKDRGPNKEADDVGHVKAFRGLSRRTASEVSLCSTGTAGASSDFEDDSSVEDTSDHRQPASLRQRGTGKQNRTRAWSRGRPGRGLMTGTECREKATDVDFKREENGPGVLDLLASLRGLSTAEVTQVNTNVGFEEEEDQERPSENKNNLSSKRTRRQKKPKRHEESHGSQGRSVRTPSSSMQAKEKLEADSTVSKVCDILLNKFNGRAEFSKLVKEKDLPEEASVVSWYESHRKFFLLFKNRGRVEFVSVYSRNVRLCAVYNKNDCTKDDCTYLHICIQYITGGCKYACCLSHDFFDDRNNSKIQGFWFAEYKNEDIAKIVRCSLPEWCEEYQSQGDQHVKACPLIHVCRNRKCNKQCGLEHNIKGSDHNRSILNAYYMEKWQDNILNRILLQRQHNVQQVKIDRHQEGPYKATNLNVDRQHKELDRTRTSAGLLSRQVVDTDDNVTGLSCRRSYTTEQYGLKETQNVSSNSHDGSQTNKEQSKELIQSLQPAVLFKGEDKKLKGILKTKTTSRTGPDTDLFKFESDEDKEQATLKQYARSTPNIQVPMDTTTTEVRNTITLSSQESDYFKFESDVDDEPDAASTGDALCEKYVWRECSRRSHFHGTSRLPYQWQIKMHDGWIFFDAPENEKIEQSFCNFNKKIEDIKVSDSLMAQINFDSMTAVTYLQFYGEIIDHASDDTEIKRLSTPSYITGTDDNMAELTQWCWHFSDHKTWYPFEPEALQYTMELKYLNDQLSYFFEREQFQYKVDFPTMRQKNLQTLKMREVMRRPMFVSPDDVKQHRKISHPNLVTKKPALSMTLPDGWTPLDCHQPMELVKLNLGEGDGDETVKTVQELFFSTMNKSDFKFKSLFRIQNPAMWEKYCSMKRTMEMRPQGGLVNEKRLFHGTVDDMKVVRGICHNNVDFRMSGKNGTVYGDGAYFARDAKYSHSYTKGPVRFMFLSRVLVGQYTKGESSYRRPPNRVGHTLYDSCVNDVRDPQIYIIFDMAQSYPEFLIEYLVVTPAAPAYGPSVTPRYSSTSVPSSSSSSSARTYGYVSPSTSSSSIGNTPAYASASTLGYASASRPAYSSTSATGHSSSSSPRYSTLSGASMAVPPRPRSPVSTRVTTGTTAAASPHSSSTTGAAKQRSGCVLQ
ncbi:uncharacterized protein LOC121390775 [Gigantopelta aegis]|uniref:uncharacterized protein LOC121390775 n=1 Tax=Gigantopelta aegis TaxID=1735272 RepID=UPI001B88C6BD|nr:uncharacterized protein LOC121390775 [Gigantopelta aegis]